jgi:hypothetical protein
VLFCGERERERERVNLSYEATRRGRFLRQYLLSVDAHCIALTSEYIQRQSRIYIAHYITRLK